LEGKKKKIHDYEKIVTNPKYKRFDEETCGSAYLNSWDPGKDELNIRAIIRKCENRKLRKEKKRRKIASKVTDDKPQNDPNAESSPDKLAEPPKRAISSVSGTEDQSTEP
jgi:hypothetical protein